MEQRSRVPVEPCNGRGSCCACQFFFLLFFSCYDVLCFSFARNIDQAEQMKQQLRRPAQFPDQFGEVSQLTQVHSFDGFRLDMSKAITPTFFTSHNVFFGNSQFPAGHYQVNNAVWRGKPSFVFVCLFRCVFFFFFFFSSGYVWGALVVGEST